MFRKTGVVGAFFATCTHFQIKKRGKIGVCVPKKGVLYAINGTRMRSEVGGSIGNLPCRA